MPTPPWQHPAGLIGRVLAQPRRYDFFQAVHLIETWLRPHAAAGHTLESVLRFRNSLSLAFPRSQIEALSADGQRVHITPAFIGFLGVKGVLPYCYTEAVAAQVHDEKSSAGRAFLDCFSQRSVLLFYQAWRQCRVEYRLGDGGRDGFLALQLAIAGRRLTVNAADTGMSPHVTAHYAALIRHRTVSAALIAGILNEYFRVPIRLEPFVATWELLRQAERTQLGTAHCRLGTDSLIGPRYRSRSVGVRLWLGPLCRRDFDHFLPRAPGGRALRAMLALFNVPGLHFEIRLMLRAADVAPTVLDRTAKLGCGSFLVTRPQAGDNADTRYMIDTGDHLGP